MVQSKNAKLLEKYLERAPSPSNYDAKADEMAQYAIIDKEEREGLIQWQAARHPSYATVPYGTPYGKWKQVFAPPLDPHHCCRDDFKMCA